jgi:hypothetical protein
MSWVGKSYECSVCGIIFRVVESPKGQQKDKPLDGDVGPKVQLSGHKGTAASVMKGFAIATDTPVCCRQHMKEVVVK